jgi:peptidoglycan hydrolase-like protein with peptidoglycan-binding domain
VKKGQQYLVNQGFSVGNAGVDGYRGNDTKKGFIKFAQTQLNKLGANLVIDGIYGNYTRSA